MAGTSSFERLVARHQRCGRPDQSAGRSFSEGLAVGQEEDTFHLSILTLAEYDKGIFNLPDNHPDRPRYIASRDALADRSGERVLPLHDQAGRRRGRISGEVKKDTGHPRPVIDASRSDRDRTRSLSRHAQRERHAAIRSGGFRSMER